MNLPGRTSKNIARNNDGPENEIVARVETFTPRDMPAPLGPYSHIARSGGFIAISAIAGIDPETGRLVGADAYSQAKQILKLVESMLASAGSNLDHVVHVSVFLKNIEDLADVDRACVGVMTAHPTARTVVAMSDLPKQGALVTMSVTAIVAK